MSAYQVIVDYCDPCAKAWMSPPTEDADQARSVYAVKANQISRGGIRQVVLTRNGVVVAISSQYVPNDWE